MYYANKSVYQLQSSIPVKTDTHTHGLPRILDWPRASSGQQQALSACNTTRSSTASYRRNFYVYDETYNAGIFFCMTVPA